MDSEFGKCEICGKEDFLIRQYWSYDIKCECHTPNHFDMVRHCKACVPVKPSTTKITIKTPDVIKSTIRRNDLSQCVPAEVAIHKAMQSIKEMGANIWLTDALILLCEAKDLVSDYVDLKNKP